MRAQSIDGSNTARPSVAPSATGRYASDGGSTPGAFRFNSENASRRRSTLPVRSRWTAKEKARRGRC